MDWRIVVHGNTSASLAIRASRELKSGLSEHGQFTDNLRETNHRLPLSNRKPFDFNPDFGRGGGDRTIKPAENR